MASMRTVLAGAAFAVACLGSAGAEASTIFVANASFEILPPGGLPIPCGVGCSYSIAAIPYWTETGPGQTGQFQPGPPAGNFTYFNSVPDGITVAYTNDGVISQTVSAVAQAGVTYTLMVDVGFRKDVPDPGVVDLVVGGNTIVAAGTPNQFSGDWVTYTATYTALAGDAGAPISILLNSGSAQGDWDNVRLMSNVPEPATWAMMLIGFGGVGFAVRRRTKAAILAA